MSKQKLIVFISIISLPFFGCSKTEISPRDNLIGTYTVLTREELSGEDLVKSGLTSPQITQRSGTVTISKGAASDEILFTSGTTGTTGKVSGNTFVLDLGKTTSETGSHSGQITPSGFVYTQVYDSSLYKLHRVVTWTGAKQ